MTELQQLNHTNLQHNLFFCSDPTKSAKMANKHSTAVISDLAKLLESAEFSDLVLRCEGQDFKVHRCIISSRSPFFAAACSGEFQVRLSRNLIPSRLTKHRVEGSTEKCC